jgi:hypothetical protein
MKRKKILILIHENDQSFFAYPPFVVMLIKEWERNGMLVEVARGIHTYAVADVVIPHIDLTVWPPEYVQFLKRYPVVLNRDLSDVSKSKISANLLDRHAQYEESVLIKTDRNYGGLPEKRILGKARNRYLYWASVYATYLAMKFQRAIPWKHIVYLNPEQYPVYSSFRDVPLEVFDNRNIVVEKFLPEKEGEFYCLRRWIFLGDKGVSVRSKSKEKIIKPANTLSIEEVPVPDELFSIRKALGCDYGKIDYVIRGKELVLFDVNRTMSSGGTHPSDFARKTSRVLAEGIHAFL